MTRRSIALTSIALIVAFLAVPADAAESPFPDVPADLWAASAIRTTAVTNDWIVPYSPAEFRPSSKITRLRFAHAVVEALAPNAEPDPSIVITDLPGHSWSRDAAVGVTLGWFTLTSDGRFNPTRVMRTWEVDTILVRALGLQEAMDGLNTISTANGYRFRRPTGFAGMVLAREMRLHYNHPSGRTSERNELMPWSYPTRAHVAYSLAEAVSAKGSWRVRQAMSYADIKLPKMSERRAKVLEFAMQYAGYPYVWAGEWHRPTGRGYCCGTQPVGGFDCTGFTWWVLRAPSRGFDVTSVRPHAGFSLPERSSADQARGARHRYTLAQTQPMDILFFDSDGAGADWRAVDHAGINLGNGWMIHSSGGRAGVTISPVGDGSWWAGAHEWSRRLVTYSW